ncbi:MAG: secretin and TonB N-terminal domain-containing protein [Steroidobacteraceae bacterium]
MRSCSTHASEPLSRDDARGRRWLREGLRVVLLFAAAISELQAATTSPLDFRIAPAPLTEVLRRVAETAGIQLLYEQGLLAPQRSSGLTDRLPVDRALERLLRGTGLGWRFVDDSTVVVFRSATRNAPPPVAAKPALADRDGVSVMPDVNVTGRANWWMLASSLALGFERPLYETPRSVTSVNGEAIEVFGLSAVEDLLRVVPGVFTTTRFGVQGSVDIRAVPADSYFRGMKRLTLQGHGRSVLGALDSIEVVAGPPPPIYGLGKIGGYTNVVPKSGRARTGGYLDDEEGFVQAIYGAYDRRELSFGSGGPISPKLSGGRTGGFYVFGLVEDSDGYTDGVPVKQRLFQAATSIDDVFGRFRLEAGANVQRSITAGALVGRLTQSLVDDLTYIGGTPLVNLDLNGNGRIGFLEMQTASPVTGRLTVNNQPLNQVFAWPLDSAGKPLPLTAFPKVSGIPKPLFDYLQSHPEADPGGLLRAQGVGGPLPIGGAVPVGMALDPRTVRTGTLDLHRSPAYERLIDASFATFYADLIDDSDPGATLRNQFFVDAMDQYKSSNQPFSQIQRVFVLEDKVTATWSPEHRVLGMDLDTLITGNLRNTVSIGEMTLADYGNHRGDGLDPGWIAATGGMIPNTTFSSSNEYPALTDDGLPWASVYRTQYSEAGLGGMAELTLPRSRGVLTLGARYDLSQARNTNYGSRYNYNTGTSASPGQYYGIDDTVTGWDGGTTWSLSYAQPLGAGLRPYLTLARSSLLLDGNNNTLANSVVLDGHVGSASLKEAGLKGLWRGGQVAFAASIFEQGREDVESDDDVNVINAYATSTTTRGWQAELRWSPTKHTFIGAHVVARRTRYTPNVGGLIQVDARALGFTDIVDATGRVVYPAEAFLYGGRARIVLPDNLPQYAVKQGNPETQLGLAAIQYFPRGFGLTLRSNYLSSTCSGRLCLVRLPSALVTDVGALLTRARAEIKLDVFNLTDERFYRARTGDTLGDVIAQVTPGRRWQITVKTRF